MINKDTDDSKDDTLEYIKMPSEMYTFELNSEIYNWDNKDNLVKCKELLSVIIRDLERYEVGEDGIKRELTGMSGDDILYFNQLMGEGEVSAFIELDKCKVSIQESVFTGVWRIVITNEEGLVIKDYIEIADIPKIIVEENSLLLDLEWDSREIQGENLINAPAILTEIFDKKENLKLNKSNSTSETAHTINLTLLPHTPEDLEYIDKVLGEGKIVILSRGYGNCRINSTNNPSVWWVRYFNSTDTEILSTIEIVDVPIVACAAQEDIRDSALRLKEIISEW